MNQIKWIWDDEKAKANLLKHQVAFSEAALVFEVPLHASRFDPHSDGDRWQTIGRLGPALLFVVHTYPVIWESDTISIGRIISARIATHSTGEPMKTEISSKLSPEQFARMERLAALPDDAIDTSDIPEVRDWTGAKRGLFYTGPNDKVAVAVDADVVAWFRSHSPAAEEYEKRINRVPSEHVARERQMAS